MHVMPSGQALAAISALTLGVWLLAAVLYAFSWYRARHGLNRLGDGLVLVGLILALVGVALSAADALPGLVLGAGIWATALAVSALAVYAVLARPRSERLSALPVLGLSIVAQTYTLIETGWGVRVNPQPVFLGTWVVLRNVTAVIGYGALAVGVAMMVLSFVFWRTRRRSVAGRWPMTPDLPTIEARAIRVALVALSCSLGLGLIRSWWGWGQAMRSGFAWALVTWLLLVAGVCGVMLDAIAQRTARILWILSLVTAVLAIMTNGKW